MVKSKNPRQPRPYINPSIKLDLHVDKNAEARPQEAISRMVDYFVAKGFKRKVVKRRRIENRVRELGTEGQRLIKAEEPDAGGNASDPVALFGLRTVLREVNKAETGRLLAICLDSGVVEMSSAVTSTFTLAAVGNQCPFYVIRGLSTTLSQTLGLPRCSAVGLVEAMRRDEEGSQVVASLTDSLMAIGRPQMTSTYVPPTLQHPRGKTPDKKWNKAMVVKKRRNR